MIAARKLALSAGKQHRAEMRRLSKIREEVRKGVFPSLKKGLTDLCKKENIPGAEYEPLLRVIELISPPGTGLSPSEIAAEIRAIYKKLCRSKNVHPVILAFAAIADDSISQAAKDMASAPKDPSGAVPRNVTAGSVVGADLTGFRVGYTLNRKWGYTVAQSIGMAIKWAGEYSSEGAEQGLPLI